MFRRAWILGSGPRMTEGGVCVVGRGYPSPRKPRTSLCEVEVFYPLPQGERKICRTVSPLSTFDRE